MTQPPDNNTIHDVAPAQEPPFALTLPQRQKVVLVMDLVESVRLMAANEVAVIDHWRGFVRYATATVLPGHAGRLVKSLGDGIMAEFDSAREAVAAALTLHRHFDAANAILPPDQKLYLRAGLNATHVYVDDIDIYGSGVNLAARVASLAGPGETMATATVRDSLTDGLDVRVEDMGECTLKHVAESVRVYRVGAAGPAPLLVPQEGYDAKFEPTLAVIPFASMTGDPETYAIGELIADTVIHQIGKSGLLRLVSRLSTTALRGRAAAVPEARAYLGAGYVLSGTYLLQGTRLVVFAELVESGSQRIVWTERLAAPHTDLLQIESEIGHAISSSASRALLSSEVQKATVQPLPTLSSSGLMLGAITLMHRATFSEFTRARQMLGRLTELHGRHAQPLAWLGKWYILQVAQGWSADPKRDAQEALSCCERALERDGHFALALAVTGQVHGYLRKDLDRAEKYYEEALACNPNESLAWLWLGMNAGFKGESKLAADATERALSLSPLDPLRYYYESLAASAAVADGRYERTIELAKSSLRLNRSHSSTYRALAIAQALSGRSDDARKTIQHLLELEPSFTVGQFLQRMPGSQSAPTYARKLADALRSAGLPE
ncbi:MAG: integral rane protein-like protein [Ramlibacter sp.]|nr:integral rane protein-like protein [Ramlibacter sp.]